jgi:hypothetical protein
MRRLKSLQLMLQYRGFLADGAAGYREYWSTCVAAAASGKARAESHRHH